MELEFTIYYLLPDGFSYVVSTHFLHADYQSPCLITIVLKRICINSLHKCTEFD